MWLVLTFSAVVVAGGVGLVWWGLRGARSTTSRIAGVAVGALLAAVAATVFSVSVWATTATDSSQFARSLVWGGSSYGDQFRFPSRHFEPATEPIMFTLVDGPDLGTTELGNTAQTMKDVLESNDTTAFIVLHGDDLLYEQYFNGSSHDAVQTSFSVAKSFTATLVGIAIDEGVIAGLNDPITDYLPELSDQDARFDDITLRHLITMSSGLAFDEGSSPWADPANTYYGTDLRSAAITKTSVERSPGEQFHYNDWNVILLGLVLERATGMSVSEYLEARLWQPMGAEAEGSWSLDSTDSGFEKMFVGINGRAIDFAKLGWLYLNEGRSSAGQVISSDFVAEATRKDTTTDPAPEYQYLWWLDEGRPGSYFANGDHCQNIYVDPSTNLVIVRHGTGCGDVDWISLFGELADWLGPQLDP